MTMRPSLRQFLCPDYNISQLPSPEVANMPLLLTKAAPSISTVQVYPINRLPSPEEAQIPPLPSIAASWSATEPAHTPVKVPAPEISLHPVPDHLFTNTSLHQLLTSSPHLLSSPQSSSSLLFGNHALLAFSNLALSGCSESCLCFVEPRLKVMVNLG